MTASGIILGVSSSGADKDQRDHAAPPVVRRQRVEAWVAANPKGTRFLEIVGIIPTVLPFLGGAQVPLPIQAGPGGKYVWVTADELMAVRARVRLRTAGGDTAVDTSDRIEELSRSIDGLHEELNALLAELMELSAFARQTEQEARNHQALSAVPSESAAVLQQALKRSTQWTIIVGIAGVVIGIIATLLLSR